MYIIIAGAGMVGGSVARELVENRHKVVMIERDRSICADISRKLGVRVIHGVATDVEVLQDAGIRKADVVVGAMPDDADNLAFTILAQNEGVSQIIARIKDLKYSDAYEIAGVTRTLSVEQLFVKQLALDIEQPLLRQVATFGDGEAGIVVATIPEGGVISGKTVSEVVNDKRFPADCVIAGIYREMGEKFFIPSSDVRLQVGDKVFLAASMENVRGAAAYLQKTK